MNGTQINVACIAARVFLKRAKNLQDRITDDEYAQPYLTGCKESGALRRASLDLTRALARMRQ